MQWYPKHSRCYRVGYSARIESICETNGLPDPQKRAAYDRHGSDPEDRYAGMSSGRSSGFATSPFGSGGGGTSFEGEMSPEDLFNMFFGGSGGFGGRPFGNATFSSGGPGMLFANCAVPFNDFFPPLVFTFSTNGFSTTRIRRNRGPQAAAGQANAADAPRSILIQLLPLIILFALSFLSSLPNLFSTPSTPDPRFSFTATQRYNTERQTSGLGIRYHVNNAEFSQHPLIAAELTAQNSGSGTPRGVLKRFEGNVERVYTQDLYNQCQHGLDKRERKKEAEIGFFGIGTNWDKIKEIEKERIASCEELKRLGVLK